MNKACSSNGKTIPVVLVGLLCGLTFSAGFSACSDTAPPPAVARPGSGGSKASGGAAGTATGGSPGNTGGSEATGGAGGDPAAGGAPGTGGAAPTDGPSADVVVVLDTAPDIIPEEVLPPPDAPGCTNPCNTARKRCSNDVVQDCVMVNGCPVWKDAVACAAPQVCTQVTTNTASCGCPVNCTAGRKRCQNGMVEECGMTDGCPAWKNATACAAPMTCMTANNNASCGCPAGPCQSGDKRCVANGGLEECKAAGPGTCPSWQAAVACPTNKECTKPGNQAADCRCKTVCTLGQKKCDGTSLSECVTTDGCPAWKTTSCAAGQACAMNGNSASCGCPDNACKIGDKICKGIGIVLECKGSGAGGCGVYEETACNNGRQCAAGPDVGGKKTASCNCPDGSCGQGDQRCDNTGVHQKCDASNSCGKWVNDPCGTPQACTPNTQGSAGACKCPPGSCEANSRKCSTDNKTVQMCSGTCGMTTSVADDCAAKGQACKFENGQAHCVGVCATPNACTVGQSKCDGDKLVKCEGPTSCPAFGQNTCAADQKCQNKPNSNSVVCCPKTCVDECVPGSPSTTIKKCMADANGCMFPTLVAACTSPAVCTKESGVSACRAPKN